MTADFDKRLTDLAAEIWRDALQLHDPSARGDLLAGSNPVLWGWNTGMFGGLGMTG